MSAPPRPRPIGALKTVAAFRAHLEQLGVEIGLDDEITTGAQAPLAQPYRLRDGYSIGNRFCIHPMEGWDGTDDGRPSELTRRRWIRFGESGAKLVWGGEAVAVRADGRANPNQLMINEATCADLRGLREALERAHAARFGRTDDLLVGLQLTHSGRFARPHSKDRREPAIVQRHPVLDARFGLAADHPLLDDDALEILASQFVDAAALAAEAGFAFVDVKHCHGYLGHELLGAHTRPGRFGGPLGNRTRFLRTIVEGIRRRAPALRVGVRVSIFDFFPFRRGTDGRGTPEEVPRPYRHAFGANPDDPGRAELSEPIAFLRLIESWGIELVNLTAGSPYYNPHIQRPALYPPSDGYEPPNDPLVDVARQIAVTAVLNKQFPGLCIVGSGYSYLQDFLPHVAQHVVRTGQVDFVGLGRAALSYPDLPVDVLAGRKLDRTRICRTFSDCTTGPRHGMVSGCFPLDPFYKARPEAAQVKALRPRAEREETS